MVDLTANRLKLCGSIVP
jgi:hypothetical protein